MNNRMDQLLQNYRLLIDKVDSWLKNLDTVLASQMQCQPGCSECCKNFTIFPVEACSMHSYIKENKIEISITDHHNCRQKHDYSEQQEREDKKNSCIAQERKENLCVFLDSNGLCRIYPARPLICRTHGYPIVIKTDTENRVDYCPKNFQDGGLKKEYFKREHLIDIDHL
ncbi:MAG: YkgJ family cysteine cluster protein, partial [Desulfamplus sp.]|nr:YkgJ family cysteine cluster protein [Desulfamplus sp.]